MHPPSYSPCRTKAKESQDEEIGLTASATAKTARAAYHADPRMYRFLKWVITRLMNLLYRYRVTGSENVPRSGAVILAVNHLHLFDPLASAPAVPRQVITLAAAKWEGNSIAGWFLRSAGSIFVRRGEVDRKALRACLEVLGKGEALAIAPEGTRSKTHSLQQAKPGIAYLATRLDVPIVPVSVWGVERLGEWRRLRRPECRVVIGQPFRLPRTDGKPSTDDLQHYADLVMLRIAQALPPAYRGVYAERLAAIEAGESHELDALRPVGRVG